MHLFDRLCCFFCCCSRSDRIPCLFVLQTKTVRKREIENHVYGKCPGSICTKWLRLPFSYRAVRYYICIKILSSFISCSFIREILHSFNCQFIYYFQIFNLKLTFGPSHEKIRFKNDIRQAKELSRSQAIDIQFMFKSRSFVCFFHSVITK